MNSFNLYDNPICYLPKEFSQLNELENLYFSNGKFIEFPSVIYALNKLKCLAFGNMQLKIITDDIINLQNLTWLYLEGNKLQFLPKSLCKLAKLNELFLNHNPLDALQLPEIYTFLKKLEIEIDNDTKNIVDMNHVNHLMNFLTLTERRAPLQEANKQPENEQEELKRLTLNL
ncbi:MAG: leucine-rich repeat domain-containing protein [Proteobacteria bacterium]|nr:leucine-rich repeat domain-containing protein [Pseudomonadota bacterium]